MFKALDARNLQINPKKFYLGYPFAKLLGQRVDALGLTTTDEKLAAISQLQFLKNLTQLEKYLGLISYLRQYIPHYATIAKPLQERKTYLNQTATKNTSRYQRKRLTNNARVNMASPKELNAFHHLQKFFASPSILHHFDERR